MQKDTDTDPTNKITDCKTDRQTTDRQADNKQADNRQTTDRQTTDRQTDRHRRQRSDGYLQVLLVLVDIV